MKSGAIPWDILSCVWHTVARAFALLCSSPPPHSQSSSQPARTLLFHHSQIYMHIGFKPRKFGTVYQLVWVLQRRPPQMVPEHRMQSLQVRTSPPNVPSLTHCAIRFRFEHLLDEKEQLSFVRSNNIDVEQVLLFAGCARLSDLLNRYRSLSKNLSKTKLSSQGCVAMHQYAHFGRCANPLLNTCMQSLDALSSLFTLISRVTLVWWDRCLLKRYWSW